MTDDGRDDGTCGFSVADLTFSDYYLEAAGGRKRVLERLRIISWGCSRPVWEVADDNRCVWHATTNKPIDELAAQANDCDLYGASVHETDLASIAFPADDVIVLTAADLRMVDLKGANPSEADLSGATLTDAETSVGADLESRT